MVKKYWLIGLRILAPALLVATGGYYYIHAHNSTTSNTQRVRQITNPTLTPISSTTPIPVGSPPADSVWIEYKLWQCKPDPWGVNWEADRDPKKQSPKDNKISLVQSEKDYIRNYYQTRGLTVYDIKGFFYYTIPSVCADNAGIVDLLITNQESETKVQDPFKIVSHPAQ